MHGFYYKVGYHEETLPLLKRFHFSCFKDSQNARLISESNWDFIEFLMSSDELPIQNIVANKPLYTQNPSIHERNKAQIYHEVTQGISAFVNDITRIFASFPLHFMPNDITILINIFCQNLNKNDKKHLRILYHASDTQHKQYLPLFGDSHYRKVSVFRILSRPLRIKANGIKRISIHIFPYLWRKFFALECNITQKIYFHIYIGGFYG